MQDIADPERRIGRAAIAAAGFQFLPSVTALHQLSALDIHVNDVTDIVLTHCDPDHAGGLADFPNAKVHLAAEEKKNLDSGNPRYSPLQFAHGPRWVTYATDDCETLGLPSRRLRTELPVEMRLVPLLGHTNGHCGVAFLKDDNWMLHVGDAYYLRAELTTDNHAVDQLATLRADNNEDRLKSLNTLRQILLVSDLKLEYFGYHDVAELPEGTPMLEDVEKRSST